MEVLEDELSVVSVSRCNMSLRAFWLKRLQTSRQHILNAQVSRKVNTYAAVIRSRSSGLTGQTPGWNRSAVETVPLTFRATGTSLPSAFCARAELKAIFTMAKRKRELLDRTNKESLATVGRLSQLRLVTQFATSSLTRASAHWRGLGLWPNECNNYVTYIKILQILNCIWTPHHENWKY